MDQGFSVVESDSVEIDETLGINEDSDAVEFIDIVFRALFRFHPEEITVAGTPAALHAETQTSLFLHAMLGEKATKAGCAAFKKKRPIDESHTTIAELPIASKKRPISPSSDDSLARRTRDTELDIDKVIIHAIEEDPFYTIAELKVVVEESLPGLKISWWSVFKLLRRHRLLSRRARFRHARIARKRR